MISMCCGLSSAGLRVSQVDRETIWANGLPDLSVLGLHKSSPREKALDYLPLENNAFPQEQNQTKSPKLNPHLATIIDLYNQMC